MTWHCRLYGHQWRHPGEFEVIIGDDGDPAHPVHCSFCGTETRVRFSRSAPADFSVGQSAPSSPDSEGATPEIPDDR